MNWPGAKAQKRVLATSSRTSTYAPSFCSSLATGRDSLRLYRAKFGTSDFDLATGFDAQAIFGAGRSETLQRLRTNGFAEEEARLTEWLARWENPTVEQWAEFRRGYFYSPEGELLLDPL
jgi:hypothetical protein